ncbi:MAG TPA: hypothetical protein VK574_19315 [Terracidiphilus sp.]|nr:hypothetical protein [Terracidiphilus sp.]
MRCKILLSLMLLGSLCLAGCGGITRTTTPPPPSPTITSVTVSCAAASLQPGQTSQCSATVSGTGGYSSSVTWSAALGKVSSTGVYTAPATAPASGSDTVKATATEDPTKLGTAKIAITSPAAPTITAVTVSCATASLQPSQTSQCTATVTGTGSYSSGVTWSATSGTVSNTGLYTAPATAPASGSDTVKATSTEDSTKLGTAKITITAPATPTITAVSLACSPTSITDTQTTSCTPTVSGTGAFTNTVNLSLSPAAAGTLSNATSVSSGTAVTFTPANTGANSVTITATSTADSTKFQYVPITVTVATAGPSCAGMSLGDNASLNGFLPFTATTEWNTDISSAPLDPNNTAITSAAGFAGLHLHHDWSSVAGGNYGIPYVVVDSNSTPLIPVSVVDYADESDVAEAPYPITAPIEGAPADCDGWPDTYIGDSHVLVLDRHACMLYETFNTHRCSGAWSASSETIWDLKNYDRRPWGWTSADAAGLPIFPGLVRYDEVAAGAINHAIRFTMQQTKNDANGGYFVAPASHAAGTTYGVSNIMGMRIRLKASFDISGFSTANKVILTAMKKYGMILADNGSYFYFQGVPDPRWDDDDLHNFDAIQSSNFEVVQMTPSFPGYDANTAPTGATPIINSFTSSASSVVAGTPITLTWNTTNDSYDFIDVLGGVSGGTVTTTPTKTTTYTLNATNQYGRTTMQVTVTVH